MKYKQITEILISFAKHLREEEKSQKTIEKYLRDIRHFLDFAEEREVTKALTKSISRSFRRTTLPSVRIP